MSEPNPNMDKLLREYAKKRRDQAGAPGEIHPATRKMLQGEVARTFGKKEESNAKSTPRFFWGTRFAWAGAVATVIILALISMNTFRDKKPLGRMAANEKSASTSVKEAAQTRGLESSAKDAPPASVAAPVVANEPAPPAAIPQEAEVDKVNPLTAAPVKAKEARRELSEEYAKSERRRDAFADEQSNRKAAAPAPTTPAAPASAPGSAAEAKPATIVRTGDDYVVLSGDAAPGSSILNSSAAETPRFYAGSASQLAKENKQLLTNGVANLSAITNGAFAISSYNEKPAYGNFDPDRTFARAPVGETRSTSAFVSNAVAMNLAVPGSAPATSGTKLAKTEVAGVSGAVIAQNFRQQDLRANLRENLQSPPQPKILSNFQVVWNDTKLKIVDGDGSVYEGSVESSPIEQEKLVAIGGRPEEEAKRQKSPASHAGGQPVSFRVSGFNRTLNQEIIFRGTNFVFAQVAWKKDLSKKVSRTAGELRDSQVSQDKKPLFDTEAALPQNIIRGFVNVGGTNEFKIEALESR